ncbi:MAG: helix-turn-helix domain-containing protein [Bryobacteraceae bacterium]|nr:helix-turn-helix domain-containing protein [Bryobacteraceae bacterium]
MGVTALDPVKYGRLCAKVVPRVIRTDKEFDHMVAKLEELDFKKDPSAEERELAELLAKLIEDYDREHYPVPQPPPHEMLRYLMEQRGLRQTDLVPVIGPRSQVSDIVNGKRGISKVQAKKLAVFFRTSAELFL